MDYLKKLDKKNNLILTVCLMISAVLFLLSDFFSQKISSITFLYVGIFILSFYTLIREIRKK
ncbi:MAG: hypothetical protein ABIJ34_04660 [archaeon]